MTIKEKEKLFKKYYPQLNWLEFKDSTFWLSCCLLDSLSPIFDQLDSIPENDSSHLNLFTDKPGPVG